VWAFLDTRPVFKGHVLVIPKEHVEEFHAMPAAEMGTFWTAVQRVSRAVEAGLQAQGTFIGLNNKISQSVPHVHAHVIPAARATACAASSGRGRPTNRTRSATDMPRASSPR